MMIGWWMLAIMALLALLPTTTCNACFLFHRRRQQRSNERPFHKNIARGGAYTTSRRSSSLTMAISSRQLSRRKHPSKTRVHYANEDSVIALLPKRSQTTNNGLLFPQDRVQQQQQQEDSKSLNSLDLIICGTYLCSSFVMNLPILLVPMAAAQFAPPMNVASLVVSTTSIAILGGGIGKLVNGLVVQVVGAKRSSGIYLVACALCCLGLSMASCSTLLGYAYGGIEYCVSMQWTALSVLFAQFYSHDKQKFAAGIMRMSLASTCGQLLAKFAGTVLLQMMSWQSVAQVGAVVAMIGACIVTTFVPEPTTRTSTQSSTGLLSTSLFRTARQEYHYSHKKQPSIEWNLVWNKVRDAAQNVLTNPLFWAVGYAHAMSMVARCSDRILGEFFSQTTQLPRSICGGLTLSVTIGLVHGLVSGRTFSTLKTAALQKRFLRKRYLGAVASAFLLALVAHPSVATLVSSKYCMAGILTLLSACMTSCMAFQFFQIPTLVAASTFGESKAVAISWLDAMAFFLNAPIWTYVGSIVATRGWSAAFVLLGLLFGMGGIVMTKAMTPILESKQ